MPASTGVASAGSIASPGMSGYNTGPSPTYGCCGSGDTGRYFCRIIRA
jgi:hypothetical protein